MSTTKVGIREFRASLADYLGSDEPVEVTRHGRTVGIFIPATTDLTEARAALRESVKAVRAVLMAQGVDPEDVIEDFKATRSHKSSREKAS